LYVQYTSHFLVDTSVACLKMFGEPNCPVCDYIAELKKRDLSAVAKKMAPKQRFYFNVLVKGEMKVLEVGRQIWDQIMAFFADPEYGNIADTESGCDIKITRSGSGLTTEYSVLCARNASKVVLPEEPKDLNKLVVRLSPEAMEEVLYSKYERLDDAVPFSVNDAEEAHARGASAAHASDASEGDDFAPPPAQTGPQPEKKPMTKAEQASWADDTFGKGKKPTPAKPAKPTPAKPGKR